jgi:hypothetical protein
LARTKARLKASAGFADVLPVSGQANLSESIFNINDSVQVDFQTLFLS